MVLPNTFLIGAQKSGSTIVYDILSKHPDIYGPFHVKDLPFFTKDAWYEKGVDFYKTLYDNWKNEQVIAGADVNLAYFEAGPERLYQLNPDLKLVFLIRNPVERAYSAYKYAVQRGLEDQTFAEAIDEEINGIRQYPTYFQKAQLDYTGHGLYNEQIKRYLEYFPREQIFIGLFEDYKADPHAFVGEILAFLNVSRSFSFQVKQNVTKGGHRFKFLNDFLHQEKFRNSSAVQGPMAMLPPPLRIKFQRRVYLLLANFNKKHKPLPAMDEETRLKLKAFFKEDILALSTLLGRDLETLWLKD